MYGEKRYSGKCGICAICSRTDYRRGSSEGSLCKIKIKSRAPLRGAYQNHAFAVRTCSKCLVLCVYDEPKAAVYAKDDLTFNGNGSLTVNANYKNGIQCKDALKFVSGTYMITAVNNGLVGKTYTICIGEQETEVTLENNYTEL